MKRGLRLPGGLGWAGCLSWAGEGQSSGDLALLGQNLPQPLPELGRGGAATEEKQFLPAGQALSSPSTLASVLPFGGGWYMVQMSHSSLRDRVVRVPGVLPLTRISLRTPTRSPEHSTPKAHSMLKIMQQLPKVRQRSWEGQGQVCQVPGSLILCCP